ncbi:MAG TPA: glutaredoxin family protein [Casimicrobiaceae bacterium]|jgi:glutaredoxin
MMLALMTVVTMLSVTAASAQTTYRYVDPSGHVVYSDRPPPASAKDAAQRDLTANVIDTDALPFATRDAMKRHPVTLYTFDCDVCRSAEAMLAKRGVPHAVVIVTSEEGAAKLKALTGGQSAPVLQVGDTDITIGYSEARWQAMLDAAGYPKDAPPLRAKAAAGASAQGGAPGAAPRSGAPAAPAQAGSAPAAQPGTPPATAPTGPGTGYPQ